MLQKVNSVLVGKFPTAYTNVDALAVGDIAMFDQDGKLLANEAAVAGATKVRFGLVEKKEPVTMPNGTISPKNSITYSQFIDRRRVATPSLALQAYQAPVEDRVTINFAGVTVSETARYAVKFIYRDLSQYKFQVTKTYDFYAVAGTTPAQLAQGIAKAINSDKDRRVSATVATSTITLDALSVTDNDGKNSINEYSQVSMDVYVYKTTESTFLYYNQVIPAGIVITRVATSDPGKGNAKIVRDRERTALAYKGATNRIYFPGNLHYPELHVDLAKTYDTLVVEWNNLYRSPDNQYIKDTPLAVEIYAEAGTATTKQGMFNAINANTYVAPKAP